MTHENWSASALTLRAHPLGSTFGAGRHRVISSLPTLRDVIGYEEHAPEVFAALHQGYPRFMRHFLVERVCAALAERHALGDAYVCPIVGPESFDRLRRYAGKVIGRFDEDGFTVAAFKNGSLSAARARQFLQHTGVQISSRHAEDWLSARGMLSADEHEAEEYAGGDDPWRAVSTEVAPWLGGASPILTCGGANAFWSAFEAVNALQAERGRTEWLQLGWLYVDSSLVLERFGDDETPPKRWLRPSGIDQLVAYLDEHSARVAGVVVEAPSNPLLETYDLDRLSTAVRRSGAKLIVDPTVASIVNVDVMPYADVVVCSLTKYAARSADVLAGCVAIRPGEPDEVELSARVGAIAAAPYRRDAARLAHEILGWEGFVRAVNANASMLAAHLEEHPAVARVRQPLQPSELAHFARIARGSHSPGALLSLSVRGTMATFFDALRVAKAASFGAEFTIAAPFLYLAHYDLVSTPHGRAHLNALGIDPDLVRVSVGIEPIDQLIAVFDDALAAL